MEFLCHRKYKNIFMSWLKTLITGGTSSLLNDIGKITKSLSHTPFPTIKCLWNLFHHIQQNVYLIFIRRLQRVWVIISSRRDSKEQEPSLSKRSSTPQQQWGKPSCQSPSTLNISLPSNSPRQSLKKTSSKTTPNSYMPSPWHLSCP